MTITLGPIPKLIKTIKFFSFYLIKVDIFGLPTYPPLLVKNVVCERPPTSNA